MKTFDVTLDPDDNIYDLFGREVIEGLASGPTLTDFKTEPVWDDRVCYDNSYTAEDVKKSLVDHDGYNPNIIVGEVSK